MRLSTTPRTSLRLLAFFGLVGCEQGAIKDTASPFGVEACDGVDNDADGQVDEGFPDADSDGMADCVDEEVCDGIDNDGDGEVDEGFEHYGDVDGDGIVDCGGVEVCNGLDDDGNGLVDDGPDSDGDGTPDICELDVCDCVDNDGDGILEENCEQQLQITVTADNQGDYFVDGVWVGETDDWEQPRVFTATVTGNVHHVAANTVDTTSPFGGFLGSVKLDGQLRTTTGDGSWLGARGAPPVGTAWTTSTTGLSAAGGTDCIWTGLNAFSGTGARWVWMDDCHTALRETDEGDRAYFVREVESCAVEEVCDGRDNDGDGEVDETFADSDGDSIADCVDKEECDCVDNDGDGLIDEDCTYELEVLWTGDDVAELTIDGQPVGVNNDWAHVTSTVVAISGGVHHIAAEVSDLDGGTRGFRSAIFVNGLLAMSTGNGRWHGASGVPSDPDWATTTAGLQPDTPADCTWPLSPQLAGISSDWVWDGACEGERANRAAYYVAELLVCPDLEVCDGIDNDGDGDVDEDFPDTDDDGIADCVDTEECDGLDNDGDGDVDPGCWGACPVPTQILECEVNMSDGSVKCSDGTEGPITPLPADPGYIYEVDMSTWTSMTTEVAITNATDWAFHWANSPTNSGWGGDAGDFENDTEAYIYNTSLHLFGNDTFGTPFLANGTALDYKPGSSGRAVLCDSYFGWTGHDTGTTLEHAGPEVFQIDGDEPDAYTASGLNDTLVYVGVDTVARSPGFSRNGGSTDSVLFFFGR